MFANLIDSIVIVEQFEKNRRAFLYLIKFFSFILDCYVFLSIKTSFSKVGCGQIEEKVYKDRIEQVLEF